MFTRGLSLICAQCRGPHPTRFLHNPAVRAATERSSQGGVSALPGSHLARDGAGLGPWRAGRAQADSPPDRTLRQMPSQGTVSLGAF